MTERAAARAGLGWLYPAVIPVVFAVHLFVVSGASPSAAPRALLAAAAVGAGLVGIGVALAGDRHRGALVALLLVFAAMATAQPVAAALITVLAVGVALVPRFRRQLARAVRWPRMTALLARATAVFAVAVVLEGVSAGTPSLVTRAFDAENGQRVVAGGVREEHPDIYFILLDTYARADVLSDRYGFDNRPFLGALEERGFDVASGSHSNYVVTWDSVPSLLNMAQMPDLVAGLASDSRPRGAITRQLVNESAGLDLLRRHGYDIVAFNAGFEQVAIREADVFYDGSELNELEFQTLRFLGVGRVATALFPDAVSSHMRSRLEWAFDTIGSLAAVRSDVPRFVFGHVSCPHAPWVFGPGDSAVAVSNLDTLYADTPQFTGKSREDTIAGYVAMTEACNRRTVAAVDRILATSARPPVILVFSDHGASLDITSANAEERLRNLFAAYTPDHPNLFPDDHTLVNTLPILSGAYLSEDVRRAPEQAWFERPDRPLEYVRIPLNGDD